MTCWRTNIPPVFKRLPPKIHKKYPKLWNISKKWPNKPSELSRTGQNCTIFKIWLHFGPFLGNITCLRTKISPEFKISPPKTPQKVSWNMLYFPKMAKHALWIEQNGLKLHNFQNLTAFWDLSLEHNMFKDTFLWFFRVILWFIYFLLPRKDPKEQLDLEYCAVLALSAKFQGIIWPFLEI